MSDNSQRFKLTNSGNLNKHKKRVHEGNKPNKYTLCNEKFRKQVDLRKHLIDNHEMQKLYDCGLPFINDFVISTAKYEHENFKKGVLLRPQGK